MVEVLEYTLVVLVSTVMVGFSLVSYTSYASVIASAGNKAASSALDAAAVAAMNQGASAVSLNLHDANVSCAGGELSFKAQGFSETYAVAPSCGFSASMLSGFHVLYLTRVGSSLEMEVR